MNMPDLLGMTAENAETAIKEAGFGLIRIDSPPPRFLKFPAEAKVIRQRMIDGKIEILVALTPVILTD
jgi:beta-lactam-binding protein with PASTA domain